ncbi:MAG: DEAD/DEAH box helicase [Anaerolineaceae bacterium]
MDTRSFTPLNSVIQTLQQNPEYFENITSFSENESRPPDLRPFPSVLLPELQQVLIEKKITSLYSHQLESFQCYREHKNFVIATGTSSGKSLCYQLPILNELASHSDGSALLLFPTKALTYDQLNGIDELIPTNLRDRIRAAIYDGDTPQRERVAIRETVKILLTNPDMLNIGIFPHHPIWERFFSQLKFVVIDEIHTYRGIFGSHIANLLRRLKRICAFYGSDPIFILTSATIRNPLELAQKLVEEEVELISQDGSPQGKKYFLVYNPPIINEEFGIREGIQVSAIKFLYLLHQFQIQTLVFCRTRRFVEILLRDVRNTLSIPRDRVRGYRSGYLREDRREIEDGLKTGKISIGIATNALELGVDIGGVDAVLLPGYPGTIAALLQRSGRAGRKFNPSLSVFIASMNPLDQFLARNPQYLLSRNPEEALINPDNPLILIEHLQCAASEIPFEEKDQFGQVGQSELLAYLNYLSEIGVLYHKNGKFHWISNDYPSQHVSLRSMTSDTILLTSRQNELETIIGEVDYNSGLWMVHPGAVYIHDGETFQVETLNLENKKATLIPCAEDFLTEPQISSEVEILQIKESSESPYYKSFTGDVLIRSKVKGFKRIKWSTKETINHEDLDLPETTLQTEGFWVSLTPECVDRMRNSGFWRSDRNNYGPEWETIRTKVRTRDHFTCQICGKPEGRSQHHVHHKIPFKSFDSAEKANEPSNLITVCPDCHAMLESQVRIRSALSGLNYLIQSMAPLMVMCDAGDLGSAFDPAAKFADGSPAIIIYDNIPAGIGLSSHLYHRFTELLEEISSVIVQCECKDGCPSCVGPSMDPSSGGKRETLELIRLLQERN